MDRRSAYTLGNLLTSAVGTVPLIEAVPSNSLLWSHRWVEGKSCGPAVRVVEESGASGLLLLVIKWQPKTRPGDWYLVGVSENDLGTAEIELHHLDPVRRELVWNYLPRKQDGSNLKRKQIFSAKYSGCEVRIPLPSSLEDASIFVEQLLEIVSDRRRADALKSLRGTPFSDISVPADEAEFPEGEARRRYVVHRFRERRLRVAKIRDVLQRTGSLACEVPGCGFNFHAVYGKLGEGYAHVHHKIPLSSIKESRVTKLQDLAIVCANCHAMIHSGGKSRKLNEVKPIVASASV